MFQPEARAILQETFGADADDWPPGLAERLAQAFDKMYETGYRDGTSNGYANWVAALDDALPFEVSSPSDVVRGFNECAQRS